MGDGHRNTGISRSGSRSERWSVSDGHASPAVCRTGRLSRMRRRFDFFPREDLTSASRYLRHGNPCRGCNLRPLLAILDEAMDARRSGASKCCGHCSTGGRTDYSNSNQGSGGQEGRSPIRNRSFDFSSRVDNVSQTIDWVRLPNRFPVRIHVTGTPPVPLRIGQTVSVAVQGG